MVEQWVKDLTEEVMGGSPVEIGRRYMWHGKLVEIVGGQYWGDHGLSNWWQWREVLADGTLGEYHSGYASRTEFEPVPQATR